MSSVTFYNSLYSDVHRTIMGFLDQQDLLVGYARVGPDHTKRVDQFYKAIVPTIEIASHVANSFFANNANFKKLTELIIKGHDFVPLVTPNGTGLIKHLSFKGKWPFKITSQQILMFLRAIPDLEGLSVIEANGPAKFQPLNGEWLSEEDKKTLKGLAKLDFSNTTIDLQMLLEILQNSTSFTSVKLEGHLISNAIFHAFVASLGLTHLNLSFTCGKEGEVPLDYAILAACHCLESFTPGPDISEEALIAIIRANPHLTCLNLCDCPADVVTDRVLQAIATHLPNVLELSMPSSHNLTEAGFRPLFQQCQALRALTLGAINHHSIGVLNELKTCRALRALNIHGALLSNEFFNGLATMTDLTTLNLSECSGFSGKSLSKIQALIHLLVLHIDSIRVADDDLIEKMLIQCPKIETLSVRAHYEPNGKGLTAAILDSIRLVMKEGLTDLRRLQCVDVPGITDEKLKDLSVELPQLRIPPPLNAAEIEFDFE